MPIQLDLRSHETKVNKSGQTIGLILHPYIRLATGQIDPETSAAPPPIFIQNGLFFAEGGAHIETDDVPDWVWVELKKCSKQSLEEAGWKGDLNGHR